MMKRLMASVLLIALTAALMTGCRKNPGHYTVELEGNATTGYTWSYTISDEAVLREVSSEYVADESDGRVGVGGKFVFEFEAKRAGETELTFEYSRAWETGVEPISTAIYTLSVDDDGNITEKGVTVTGE